MKYIIIILSVFILTSCQTIQSIIDYKPDIQVEHATPLDFQYSSILFTHNAETKTYSITEEDAEKLIEILDDTQFWIESEKQNLEAYQQFYTNK